MNKLLLAGAAFLLIATALPATAGHRHHHKDDNNNYGERFRFNYDTRYDAGDENDYGYRRGYAPSYYTDHYYRARQQLRECREHRYVHRDLSELHGDAHDQGFDDREDHGDTHEALGQAHGSWHRDHSNADYCAY